MGMRICLPDSSHPSFTAIMLPSKPIGVQPLDKICLLALCDYGSATGTFGYDGLEI